MSSFWKWSSVIFEIGNVLVVRSNKTEGVRPRLNLFSSCIELLSVADALFKA